ncbi:ATP-binding cassette domain-containing protein [Streptosporangium lutulentum]
MPDGPLLRIDGLVVDLPTPDGGAEDAIRIVDGVSFDVLAGTTVGLIGESGSGKTMTALAVIGLLPDGATTGGELLWRGEDLLRSGPDRRRRVRGHEISMIFQDPLAALNPSLTIG